jgi:hypothetical protein
MRRIARLLGVLAISSAITLGLMSSPAWASTRLDACGTGVCGSATFSYVNYHYVSSISMNVADTRCDSNDVYIRFVVYYPGGHWYSTQRRDSNGCGTSVTWNGLALNDDRGIWALRVQVCVDDYGSDTCYLSGYSYNPYF